MVVSEWAWDPDTYLAEMAAEVPGYDELQEAVVAATGGIRATRVLELGTGTGETALRVRAFHPEAGWVGIDASEPMLARARERLPDADLRLQRLEDELPSGPFDLVRGCKFRDGHGVMVDATRSYASGRELASVGRGGRTAGDAAHRRAA